MRLPIDPTRNVVIGGDLPKDNTKEYIEMVIGEFKRLPDDFYLAEVVVPRRITGFNLARAAQSLIRRKGIEGVRFAYNVKMGKLWILRT